MFPSPKTTFSAVVVFVVAVVVVVVIVVVVVVVVVEPQAQTFRFPGAHKEKKCIRVCVDGRKCKQDAA